MRAVRRSDRHFSAELQWFAVQGKDSIFPGRIKTEAPAAIASTYAANAVWLRWPKTSYGGPARTGRDCTFVDHASLVQRYPQQIGAADGAAGELTGTRKLQPDRFPVHWAGVKELAGGG